MDDRGENISWAENMFQKLEDLYLEVDVVLRQEIRNVETHLQTISANVINFYRDIVLKEPPRSSDDVTTEERADDSVDILVSDGSKLCIYEVHHEEEPKKEVAHDIDYPVSYTSDEEEDTEEEEDDASEDCSKEDTEEEADDDSPEEATEEETDDILIIGIDTDECNSEEDTKEEAYSEEDSEPEPLFSYFVPGASKAASYEQRRKLRLEFYETIFSALVEPIDESQYDSESQLSVDSGVYETTSASTVSPVAGESIDENIDMPDIPAFEITGQNEDEEMLALTKSKAKKLFGVTDEVLDDEFCDSEWVLVQV
ncbi:nucleolin-like isoform X3 [Mangifera indica]|nr:nucleolin-like isoform X3 [Mangifera indica]XP_044462431.1 nucleolin-like isoform X3 [Mangifera indica]XP_044462432.1 nucleolin-like isoform X3 [Mangifera indica]